MKLLSKVVAAFSLLEVVNAQGCTLMAIVMDESGSMDTEQAFLREGAMEDVVNDLELELEETVYICTFGFLGSAVIKGCSKGFDTNDFTFDSSGGTEDGWNAIDFANTYVNDQATIIDGDTLSSSCPNVSSLIKASSTNYVSNFLERCILSSQTSS